MTTSPATALDDVDDDPNRGYRSYEIHQRQREHEATSLITPGDLHGDRYCDDPYASFAILRENYPCYRDWYGNSYWVTRYDDVTSVLADDASYEFRTRRWHAGLDDVGRDLGREIPVWWSWANGIDRHVGEVAATAVDAISSAGGGNLAIGLAARVPLDLLATVLDIDAADRAMFAERYLTMQRGVGWEPRARVAGHGAFADLVAYFEPIVAQRRRDPGDDLISAVATFTPADGSETTATDLVVTLLEREHETLHGALANLWFLLLTHPDQLEMVRAERRFVKYAHLEATRHSTPVLTAAKFTTREVERFGRLLPEGALVVCAAGAANRDPRAFSDPDRFDVDRRDMCLREPRGHYRADGLPSGISVGLGTPSKFPALPQDRPRSWYALVRDTVETVSTTVLDRLPNLALAPDASPRLRSLRVGEMHTCWELPVVV